MAITYKTLTAADRLLVAKDRLRGLEADHYRVSVTSGTDGVALSDVTKRLGELEVHITNVQSELETLENSSDAAPEDIPAPQPTIAPRPGGDPPPKD